MDIPPARPRPRPQKPKNPDATRESNALRASVLDAAMQLGLGNNPAVADWMFDNQLKEEDEDQIPTSPGLTHSEESPSSSPLSSRYPLTPSSPQSSQNHSSNAHYAQKALGNFHLHHATAVPFAISSESRSLIPHSTDAANVPARPSTPSKLKKKRSATRDGYESDGGHFSDTKRKNDKKKDKEKASDFEFVPPMPAFSSVAGSSANSFLTFETASDMTVDGNDPWNRKKSLKKAPPYPRSAPSSPFESSMGYDTDSSKKSKKKSKKVDGDKEPKKSRSLFFRLGSKSPKEPKKGISVISVQVEKNSTPPQLPIADMFATTMNKETGAPMISLGGSDLQSSSGGSGAGSGLGFDLGLGLSGDMFSTNYPLPPRPKVPTRPKTADSVMSSSIHTYGNIHPPLPSLSIPPPQINSTPPAFPPPSSVPPYGPRPGSAGTTTTARTSTSTNPHSTFTGPARTSYATSVSTSQSHPLPPNKGVVLSRESSSGDVPNLPPPYSPNSIPLRSQTPIKRRPIPILANPGDRGSASSRDSVEKEREKEKEKKREENRREKERKERDSEREKKPLISLPLTRAASDSSEGTPILMRNQSIMQPPTASSHSPVAPLRLKGNGSPVDSSFNIGGVPIGPRNPSRPPIPPHFMNHNGLSRQISMSQLHSYAQPPPPALSRQISLSTLRPDGSSLNGHASPISVARSVSPLPSGRASPLTYGPGINSKGSPPGGSRTSALPGPPNVLAHYDFPPPSPPPLAPLPSVPTSTSPVPPTPISSGNGAQVSSANSYLNVGIAVTTGSPLPSPLLMTSPHFNGAPSGTGKVPPTSFNPSSAAAGNALRAKVQRRLSQTDGFPTLSSSNATNTPPESGGSSPVNATASTLPFINGPTLSRGTSTRGRESPFPVAPISKGHSPSNTLAANNASFQAQPLTPQTGWDDSGADMFKGTPGGEVDYDDDGIDDVRVVIERFRESRVDERPPRRRMEGRHVFEDASPRSFDAFQQGSIAPPGSASSLNGTMPVSPSPSSNILGVNSDTASGKYDSFTIDEYYGHGGSNGGNGGAAPSSFAAFENEDLAFDDDDLEDASRYPEDEMPSSSNRRSRRRRSTVYLSDEEDNSSNSGHEHSGKERKRYSASIYSRASFLDTERSGEVRQRFLKHVEAMLDERGQHIPAVPPVPKLPEEFVAESRRTAIIPRKDREDLMVQRTVGVGARKIPAGIPVNVGR